MRKKILVGDVEPGMFLDELCGSWIANPFWRSRFVVTDPGDIAMPRASKVREVWIDVGKGADVRPPAAAAEPHRDGSDGKDAHGLPAMPDAARRCRWPRNSHGRRRSAPRASGPSRRCSRRPAWAMRWTMPVVKVFFQAATAQRMPPMTVDLSERGCPDKILTRENPADWRFPDLHLMWSVVDPVPGAPGP